MAVIQGMLSGVKPKAPAPSAGSTMQGAITGLRPAQSPVSPVPSMSGAVGGLKAPAPIPSMSGSMGGGLKVPTGKPADANPWMVGTGSSPANPTPQSPTPVPVTPPPAMAPSGVPMAQGVQTKDNTGLGANVSKINPQADLRFQSVLPTATNRFDLAQKNIQNFKDMLQPDYLKDNRAITQRAAALGRVGNQDNVSDFGGGAGFNTLDRSYADRVGQYATGVFNNALENQIGDESNARNEIRGERGYQNELEDSAYNRARQGVFDTDALTNSAFGRAEAQNAAGQAGNPAQFLGVLGQNAQQQAGQSTAGISDFIKNLILGNGQAPSTPQVTQNGKPVSIQDLIKTTV